MGCVFYFDIYFLFTHIYLLPCSLLLLLLLYRHVSKLYQWKTQGSVAVGTIVPNKTATFASKCIESGEKLHNIIMGMIGCNPSNLRLQHRLLAASQCYSLMNKIESFDSIEYHDDFADWLLQTKLEESGFIVTAPTLTKIGTTDNDFEDKLVSR